MIRNAALAINRNQFCIGLFACIIATAACGCAPDGKDVKAEHVARENDLTLINPAGRYSMLDGGSEVSGARSIIVLDSREGRISKCTIGSSSLTCTGGISAFP
jgi:hypothetical protein